MGSLNMVIATTSLDTRSPFKEAIQNAKSSGKQSTKLATKKSRSKNVKLSMSKKLMKIPKLNVLLDMKRNAKTNGSALTIPSKKWQPTNEGCKSIHVDNCQDVPFTRYEDVPEQKCRTIHKQVSTQITGKVAFRECPGKSSYEYTPTEVREYDFTGY